MSCEKKINVVLGVTGSIAAYKACEIVRLCVKRGWNVFVVMTDAATKLVTPLTFQTLSRNAVSVGLFECREEWKPEHISLADRADVFAVAPCTANVIAKMAAGFADDMLTTSLLATKAPVVVAPAMNVNMYENAATRANIATLKARGITVLDADNGELACGVSAPGRMMAPEKIVEAIGVTLA